MSEVYRVWFRKAASMKAGERIFLPVETKNEGQHVISLLKKEQDAYAQVDAVEAASVNISPPTMRDNRLWVILRKMAHSPLVAFVKTDDEAVPQKVILGTDEVRLRKISGYIRSNMMLNEIQEAMGPLSEDEIRYFGLEDWEEE